MYKNNFSLIFQLQLIVALSVFGFLISSSAFAEVPFTSLDFTFSQDLQVGSRGEEVLKLQTLLNNDLVTQVSPQGPGSPGLETDYFGEATLSAVIKFQEKYASDILSPLGLSRGTGFVGAKTRMILNGLVTFTAPAIAPQIETPIPSTLITPLIIPTIKELSPTSGPNGTKITIIGENFRSLNTVVTSFKEFPNLSSTDGKTIEFTFNNPPFAELQKIRNTTNNIKDIDIPFNVFVVNENGTTTSATFTVQIKKR